MGSLNFSTQISFWTCVHKSLQYKCSNFSTFVEFTGSLPFTYLTSLKYVTSLSQFFPYKSKSTWFCERILSKTTTSAVVEPTCNFRFIFFDQSFPMNNTKVNILKDFVSFGITVSSSHGQSLILIPFTHRWFPIVLSRKVYSFGKKEIELIPPPITLMCVHF